MADYAEMDNWPQEQYGEDGQFYAERKLKCAWDDRYDVLIAIAGNGGQLYPYNPDTEAIANGAAIIPFAAMDPGATVSPIAAYDYAIITVRYSTLRGGVKLSGNWVTEELQPTSKLINVNMENPRQTWLVSGNPPVLPSDNVVKLETSFDYVVTYHNLMAIPVAAYTQVGKVNSAPVGSWLLGLTFAVDTLLHTRPIVIRTFDPALLSTFRLAYRFSYLAHTWNKHWHVNNYYATTADPLYESFNFTSLMP